MYLGNYFILVHHEAPERVPEQQTHSGSNERPVKYLSKNIRASLLGRRRHAQGMARWSQVIALTKVSVFDLEARNRYSSHADFVTDVEAGKTKPLSTGLSFCAKGDTYDRRKGLNLALNRALRSLGYQAEYHKSHGWKLITKPVKTKTEAKTEAKAQVEQYVPGHDGMLSGF